MPAKKRSAAPSPAVPLDPSSRVVVRLGVVGRDGKSRVPDCCLRVEILTQYVSIQAVFGSRLSFGQFVESSLRVDRLASTVVASADIGEECLAIRSPELTLGWHSRNFLASVEVSRRGSFGQRGKVGRFVVEYGGFRIAAGERVTVWCLRDEMLTQYLVA
jgi:hypothetical protein